MSMGSGIKGGAMDNGVYARKKNKKIVGYYWRCDEAKSADHHTKEDAERDYIHYLLGTRYAELLRGKSYERQRAIVFGPE